MRHLIAQLRDKQTTYRQATKTFRRLWLLAVLTDHKGNQCAAAQELEIHRNNLTRWMKQAGITHRDVYQIKRNYGVVPVCEQRQQRAG